MSSLPRVVCTAPVKCKHLANARQHSLRLHGLHRLKPAASCVGNGVSPRKSCVLHYSSKAAVCMAATAEPRRRAEVLSVEMAMRIPFPSLVRLVCHVCVQIAGPQEPKW